jgi:alpha-galactosidase
MMIDNCASGGRRNDLETLHRSVHLLRSDYVEEPIGQQCHTYGLASWVPFWGTGIVYSQPKDLPYMFRSQMSMSFTSCWDITPKGVNYDLHRKLIKQWRELAPNMLGDYYPIMPYTQAEDQWIAWQFDRPEAGQGMVQAFRRDKSIYESARLVLRGLDPSASYMVTNIDTGKSTRYSARDLMEQGYLMTISERPGAAILSYKRAR